MSSRASATIGFMAGRPAAARRAPLAPAAVALAVFAAVGIAVLDDYGVGPDEGQQRLIGQLAVNYVLPGAADLPADRSIHDPDHARGLMPYDRYYGVAFEAPLILIERLLRLRDSRAVFLSRRLLTHLFFLTGGLFCYLLAYRLFGDRYLALFALLLFLLHPRLYAHSFFNSKDLPFLAMFMIALYLLERACRRGSVAAFALCGVGVGVLVNLRVMGVMLFAAGVGLRTLDLLQARGPAERRRVLAATAALALAACGTLYALSPYAWRDPLALVDGFKTFTERGREPSLRSLFQGEIVNWPSIPRRYLPTYIAITTPPATLLLCLAGAADALARCAARPRSAAGNTTERFTLLLAACLVLPIAAVVAARPNLYNGWRHMYFLYAPACLLSVCGLRALLTAARRLAAAHRCGMRGVWLRRTNRMRRGVYALAAAALAGMAVEIVRLHPYQDAYFNFLVDRRTPERLRTQYRMTHWGTEAREGLQYLLARFPDSTFHLDAGNHRRLWRNRLILDAEARRRIVIADPAERIPHFVMFAGAHVNRDLPDDPFGPVLYRRRIYHSTVLAVTAVDLSLLDEATVDGYRAAYRAALAGEPLLRSEFDLYLDGGTLTWVKEACRPEDTAHPFLVRAVPAAADDSPAWLREHPREPAGFRFGHYGVRFDGRCLIRRRLPGYPIRALQVGRLVPGAGSAPAPVIELPAAGPPVSRYRQAHAAIAAGERGAPDARSAFDLYLGAAGAELVYHKEPCAPEDVQGRFFVHLFPADPAELDPDKRQAGYYNHGFYFADHGVLLSGGACVALVPLPAYEHGVAHVRAGQFDGWITEFAPGD